MDTKLITCQNCRGNGYVRIPSYEETQTCKECGGAGYFGSISKNKETRLKDNHPLQQKVDDASRS